MKRARTIVLLAACAGALAACNLLAGLTEDYTVVGANGDGSMPGDEANGDGSTNPEGSTQDGPIGDGGLDSADGRGPAVAFCDREHDAGDATVVFCSDFEMGGLSTDPNPFGWGSIMRFGGPDAAFNVEPAGGFEGAGLSVVTNKPVSGSSVAAWLEKQITAGDPNVAAHYQAELQLRAEQSQISYTALGILTFDDSDASVREHGVATDSNNGFLKELNPGVGVSVGNNASTWHHIVIQLDRPSAGAPYDRRLTIDGVSGNVTPAMSYTSTGAVKLRIGTFNTGTGVGVLKAHFDNVLVHQW